MSEEAGPTLDAGRLVDVLDDVGVCVYVKDPEGRYLYINRAGAEAIGLTVEAMVGRLEHEVVQHETARAWHEQDLQVLHSRVPWDGEETHGDVSFMTHKVPLFDAEGRAVAVIGVSTDITATKRRESRLTDAQQIAGVGSWHWDAQSGQTTMSLELCRIYGIDPPEGQLTDNDAALALVHPDDRERVTAAVQATFAGAGPLDLDMRIVRRSDSAERVVHLRAEVTLDDEGTPCRLDGTCSDVTERRSAERRLADAQRLAQLGAWEWDLAHDEIEWSAEMYRILGVDPEHFVPTRGGLLDRVDSEDRERLTEAVDAAVEARGSFDTFFTISRPDGERREVRLRGTVVTAPGPRAGHVLGICQDLTDLRRTQADLAEAVELFKRCFEDAPVGMAMVDRDGGYRQVNDALCAFLGRSREELTGLSVMDVTDSEDVAESEVALGRLFNGVAPGWIWEKRYLRPDGSSVWGALRASVIHDAEGVPLHGLVVIEDITERRRAELRRKTLHDAATVMAQGGPLQTALPALVTAIGEAIGWGAGSVRLTEFGEQEPPPSRAPVSFPLMSGSEIVGIMEFDGCGVAHLSEELTEMTAALGAQIGEFVVRKRTQEQLMHLALHDPLTRLPNRVLFFDRLDQAIRRAQREPAPLAVLFLDFDGFKAVNDRFGHAGGDDVLRRAAERVASALRANDTVARFGGDELVILSEHLASREAAEAIAQRVLAQLVAPIELEGEQVELTASIGVCIAAEPGATRDELLRAADAAMYQAKAAGSGRYVIAE